ESSQLDLTNVDANPAFGEVSLDELLERVVAAADGEQVNGEGAAILRPYCVCLTRPARSIEERVRGTDVVHRLRCTRQRVVWRRGAGRGRSVAGQRGSHDAITIEREIDRASSADVVKGRAMGVQHQPDTEENRIFENPKRPVSPNELGHRR